MTKKLVSLFLALMAALSLVPGSAQGGLTLTDMAGREITLDAPAARVVALTASDCEILYAIGAGDTLAGRGSYCDYPEEALSVPEVNSGAETNIEQIIALSPQVVIMSIMAQTKEQIAALEAAGIKVVVSDAQDIEGVYEAVDLLGALTGRGAEAAALIGQMKRAFQEIKEASGEGSGQTVYFEVSPLEWGLWAAGKNTFMDELAELCGLENAFSDVDGWAEISQEQVLERDPDYIVTTSMYLGQGPTPVEEIKGRAGWDGLKAVENDHVLNADSNTMTRPGPRLVEAAQALFAFTK